MEWSFENLLSQNTLKTNALLAQCHVYVCLYCLKD